MEEKNRDSVFDGRRQRESGRTPRRRYLYDRKTSTSFTTLSGLEGLSPHRLDVDYMIKDGEIVIVDEFTGRLIAGPPLSDGLHQAIEAKEKVKVRMKTNACDNHVSKLFPYVQQTCGNDGNSGNRSGRFKRFIILM